MDLGSVASTADARHDAIETIVGGGPSTVIHDQTIRTGEARLAAELGLSDWLGLGLILPYRFYNTSVRYLDPAGAQVDIENPFIHHHNETLTGIGDPWIYGRVARSIGRTTIGGRAGLTIPLGRTVPDPFVLGDMGLPHEHSQFGTGTLGIIAGVEASRSIGKVHLDASMLTMQTFYANGHGYQSGDRYFASIGAASSFGTKRFRFRATIASAWETAESWSGVVHTDDGNIGRTDVLAGGSITWLATSDWYLGLDVRVPVYTHIEGGQLDALGFVGLNVGTHFHLFGDASDEHAKRPPGDWTGLDKLDASTGGRIVPLATVPGKITVYDFWATWCKPCGVLDGELAAVARRHPDDLAVRKIDVVDGDSPAYTTYLGDALLPYVKVFGRDGTLLWERSGSPLALAAAVEEAITGPRAKVAIPAGTPRVAIAVTDAGFEPGEVTIDHGHSTVLVFTRTSTSTCATDVHFILPDGTKIDEDLPLNTPVEIALAPDRPGRIDYACGMNMTKGTIVVR